MTEQATGKRIGTGRSADVFDIGGGRVLRSYRDGRPPAAVAREAEVMVHARAHGVPVPEVFEVSGANIIMERVTGPTMLDVLTHRPWLLWSHARLLARLHGQVHAVPPLPWLRASFGVGQPPDPAATASPPADAPATGSRPAGSPPADAPPVGTLPAAARPAGSPPTDAPPVGTLAAASSPADFPPADLPGDTDGASVLLHYDLHPQNVILTPDGPQLIDWEGATQGPAVADIAMTWTIIAFSNIPGSRPEVLVGHLFQSVFARAFLHAASGTPGSASGVTSREWLAAGLRNRLGDPHLYDAEAARLRQALRRLG